MRTTAKLTCDWPILQGYSVLGPHERTPARRGGSSPFDAGDRMATPDELADLESLGIARHIADRMGYLEAAGWVEYLWTAADDWREERLDSANARIVSSAYGEHPNDGTPTCIHLLHKPSGAWALYIAQQDGEQWRTRELPTTEADGRRKVIEAQHGLQF